MFMSDSIGTPISEVNRYSDSLRADNIGMSIGSRIKEARRAKKLTQKELAAKVGMAQASLSELETGESQGTTMIASFAAALGVNALWLETGKGAMHGEAGSTAAPASSAPLVVQEDDGFITGYQPGVIGGLGVRVGDGPATIPIRAVKLRLQAGVSGFVAEPDMEIDHGYFQVPKEVIDQLRLNPEDLIVTTIRGRSMEPMMFEDDKVLVDTSKTRPKNNECFAVNWNGEAIVKCLIKKSEGWHLYSFNRDFPTIDVRSGQCSIIGMVVWQPARIVVGRL